MAECFGPDQRSSMIVFEGSCQHLSSTCRRAIDNRKDGPVRNRNGLCCQLEFLETDASLRQFFAQFRVKDDVLAFSNKFGELLPVSVRREKSLTLLFTFIDEGQRSIAKFQRFLSKYDKLLCSLSAFKVVYVAITPELFKEAQQLSGRLFPARPVTHLKTLPVIDGQTLPTILKADLIVELVQDCYPSLLESDPVCDAVWRRERLVEQKSLFSSEMPNDAV